MERILPIVFEILDEHLLPERIAELIFLRLPLDIGFDGWIVGDFGVRPPVVQVGKISLNRFFILAVGGRFWKRLVLYHAPAIAVCGAHQWMVKINAGGIGVALPQSLG